MVVIRAKLYAMVLQARASHRRLTRGMDERLLREGERGVLAKILPRSSMLSPRGRLPMVASPMKLLWKLRGPILLHESLSACSMLAG